MGVGEAEDQVAERPERGRRARGEPIPLGGINQTRPERSGGRHLGEADGEQGRRVRGDGIRVDPLERFHDPFADPARRHVDDPAQADVVVRIDDQLEVRQRVLDFLPFVEADAADHLVRHALAHERVFNRARL